MLTNRIIGAFTFRKGVYAEVEQDSSFTQTAWIIVAVVAFLNQVGSFASGEFLGWVVGAVVGTIFAVIGFAVGALVISWVGRTVFNADVAFDELVRTLVWPMSGRSSGFWGSYLHFQLPYRVCWHPSCLFLRY